MHNCLVEFQSPIILKGMLCTPCFCESGKHCKFCLLLKGWHDKYLKKYVFLELDIIFLSYLTLL